MAIINLTCPGADSTKLVTISQTGGSYAKITTGDAKAGRDPGVTFRFLAEFDTAPLAGKTILAAELRFSSSLDPALGETTLDLWNCEEGVLASTDAETLYNSIGAYDQIASLAHTSAPHNYVVPFTGGAQVGLDDLIAKVAIAAPFCVGFIRGNEGFSPNDEYLISRSTGLVLAVTVEDEVLGPDVGAGRGLFWQIWRQWIATR